MTSGLPKYVRLEDEVREALGQGRPVVALETAVVTHGLPWPVNVDALRLMEQEVRDQGATPATCLVDEGCLWIGATPERVQVAAQRPARRKASVRDLGYCLATGATAGLTVSATIATAQLAGIQVFATGGIGGVHVGAETTGDVSADLLQLARSRVVTVCSGAKSVLDIPRTLEYLETLGVSVFGYQTSTFPAFYLLSSGQPVVRLDDPESVARTARTGWELDQPGGLVLGVPIPEDDAIPAEEWAIWMEQAHQDAHQVGIRGQDVTPHLLAHLAELSGARTIRANIRLLRNNARVAGLVACALQT